MKVRQKIKKISMMALAAVLLVTQIYVSPVAAADPPMSFFSSFEDSDAAPLKHATVNHDGTEGVAVGVTVGAGRIGGDMMKLVTKVEGSAGSPGSGEGVEKLADNTPETKWCDTAPSWSGEVYALYTLSNPVAATTYLICTANDHTGYASRMIRDWRIQGSNDKVSWTTLDTRTNESFTGNYTDKIYTFTNTTPYLYYKLIIDNIQGGRTGTLQVADWSLGTSSDVIFGTSAVRGLDFDLRRAFESAVKSSAVVNSSLTNGGHSGLATSIFNGFTSGTGTGTDALSWGLEGYINDFGIAQMAIKLGYLDEAAYYTGRATNYINYWNPDEVRDVFQGGTIAGGWMRSKGAPDATTGVASWSQTSAQFSPYTWLNGYTETNAFNMAFTLVDAMGMSYKIEYIATFHFV